MPFTRSIRRKLMLGLSLVGVVLAALSLNAIFGLRWYRDAVDDLDFALNEAPRRADLAAAIGTLFEPLDIQPRDALAARVQQEDLAVALAKARNGVMDFHGRLDRQPPTPDANQRRPVAEALLVEIYGGLNRLKALHATLPNSTERERTIQRMLWELVRLEVLAQQMPDAGDGQTRALLLSRRMYKSRFRWVVGTSVAAAIMFVCLAVFGYRWIFVPVRILHRGASRVAQGDFDYRVKLKTGDEMAELAESFNKMTARFQEIRRDLDRQVRDRSRQLVRSERLAGVGFLAAGVAHEINNPLSAIAMAAESIESRSAAWLSGADDAEAEIVREYLRMIQAESFRCRDITARLLDFSRTQDTTRGRHDLAGIVSEVLTMVRLGKYRDRNIEFDPARSCWAEVSGPEIKQVVLNLVANSLEAMPADGKLRIDIAERTDETLLTFADDGCGMTPEVIEHLFEPFFTRRESGKGTGLGLAISHRIVTDHGGTIEATSEGPGQGSTFRVHLPRKTSERSAAA
ncbi:MAG: ATP-binding protein [Planctomycetaceae bacterium]